MPKLMMKITTEKRGILLQELLSFLLDMNGKAKQEDVIEYFLDKSPELATGFSEDEYLDLVKIISSLCVNAEWIKKTGFWKVTKYGIQAYSRFKQPKILFQEMAVQSVFSKWMNISKNVEKTQILGIVFLILGPAICIYSGLVSSNPYLIALAIISVFALLLSIIFNNFRTRLVILGRVLFLEFLILSTTLFLDTLFLETPIKNFFESYYISTLVFQGACLAGVFVFPRIVLRMYDYINESKWIMIIPTMVLVLLFGGRFAPKGLLYFLYGRDVANLFFPLTYTILLGIGILFISGGIISQLERIGYYD